MLKKKIFIEERRIASGPKNFEYLSSPFMQRRGYCKRKIVAVTNQPGN